MNGVSRTSSSFINVRNNIIMHTFMMIVSIALLLPLIWTFMSTIKIKSETLTYPPIIIPSEISFNNYVSAFTKSPILKYLSTSISYALCTTVIAVLISVFCAYAFSRFDFKGKKFFISFVLFTMLFPWVMSLIPLYSLYTKVGLTNTFAGLVLINLPWILAFTVWVLKVFFDDIPLSIEESAKIDGCSEFRVVTSIIFPVAMPCIISVSIIDFVSRWNEFMLSFLFVTDRSLRTLPVGIYDFIDFSLTDYGKIFAVSMAAIIPPLILFLTLRDRFVNAIMQGAIKE